MERTNKPERTGNGWMTPDWLLDMVEEVGPIVLDPCTYRDNPVGADYIRTIECDPDGLATDWAGIMARVDAWQQGLTFVNPPYGRGLMQPWAEKIVEEARNGVQIIALTRGDTSTKWARLLLGTCQGACFPPRIKFKGAKGSPNFANILFYWGDRGPVFRHVFQDLGPVVTTKRGRV